MELLHVRREANQQVSHCLAEHAEIQQEEQIVNVMVSEYALDIYVKDMENVVSSAGTT